MKAPSQQAAACKGQTPPDPFLFPQGSPHHAVDWIAGQEAQGLDTPERTKPKEFGEWWRAKTAYSAHPNTGAEKGREDGETAVRNYMVGQCPAPPRLSTEQSYVAV
jgi:hypothetical protein